jgi:16S rRNA (cytosine1402-N4)-methyltransferase
VQAFEHRPVLLAEVLEQLRLRPGAIAADGTLGGAGHAAAILRATSPNGFLYGCDRDGDALEAAARRLAEFAGRFELRQAHYATLGDWVPADGCDAVLLDLGVSSYQLDTPGRGFSFSQDGPLDMRMDGRQARTAAQLVHELSAAELARIFWEFGGEPQARRIAARIVRAREGKPLCTTAELAALVAAVSPRHGKKTHPATKVFQALRIAVNDELAGVRAGLLTALGILKPGGRLAVISFHSLEDRLVKQFGREQSAEYVWDHGAMRPDWSRPRLPALRVVTRKAIRPDGNEVRENPRSRSAQLRVFEKTGPS